VLTAREICIDLIFKLSSEHVMFTELSSEHVMFTELILVRVKN